MTSRRVLPGTDAEVKESSKNSRPSGARVGFAEGPGDNQKDDQKVLTTVFKSSASMASRRGFRKSKSMAQLYLIYMNFFFFSEFFFCESEFKTTNSVLRGNVLNDTSVLDSLDLL